MSDVRWDDGDVIFEDGDVLFDPPESALEVQEPRHGVINDVVAEQLQTTLGVVGPTHKIVKSYLNLVTSDTSDVYWEDTPSEFQDLDVEFVPKEDAFATQEPSHAVVSTNCSLTFEALLSVTSPDHGLVSTEQNVTLSGSVSVTDTEHGVSGSRPGVDTSKFLSVGDSNHSLAASQQDLTLHTELTAANPAHKVSGTHPILSYAMPPEQQITVNAVKVFTNIIL